MFLRFSDSLRIENLNNYPVDVVSQLQTLLASGVEARLDPKRKHFYDVETSSRGFFIHAAPLGGNVLLLATWLRGLPLRECVAGA